ncbi:hypothetical protein LLB_0885 [Legionella longbeachae D-4968]|nr:hypothetical protein LLB_0885 [Legionella longbeachae D-4968]
MRAPKLWDLFGNLSYLSLPVLNLIDGFLKTFTTLHALNCFIWRFFLENYIS